MNTEILQDWSPIKHSIFKSEELAQEIHKEGYAVVDFISEVDIKVLADLYAKDHNIPGSDGGMFYSLYSHDLAYRERVFSSVSSVLQPYLNRYFENYKEMIHSYIVKLPGPKSQFFIHQDTTGLDEFKYSPLSVWLPLDDVTEENGCICLVPKSHHFFGPYRGISFPSEFDEIKDIVAKYLIPIRLKKGQALIFDPRVIHNSLSNVSNMPRIVSLTGLFPKEASFVHCYTDMSKNEKEIEFYKQDDDFLLKYPYLLVNCTERPTSGEVIKKIPYSIQQMDAKTFYEKCAAVGLQEGTGVIQQVNQDCTMIAEPKH